MKVHFVQLCFPKVLIKVFIFSRIVFCVPQNCDTRALFLYLAQFHSSDNSLIYCLIRLAGYGIFSVAIPLQRRMAILKGGGYSAVCM